MLTANYHTHTVRCNHARGSEREFIEEALRAGLTTLGFADHAPMPFPGTFYSGFRMRPDLLPDYVETLLGLREEYRGRIKILIGLEAEYYPALFNDFLGMLRPYPIDYLIMGQHYMENEMTGLYSGRETKDPELLHKYVAQTCEGLRTGRFTYFAHPDLLRFTGEEDVYEREMTQLICCARDLEIPLEINFLGIRDHRHYPRQSFFRLAGKLGAPVIFGSDAHSPDVTVDAVSCAAAEEMVKTYGLRLVECPVFRSVF